MGRLLGLALVVVACPAAAHWDGDDNADGHRYKGASSSLTIYHGNADDALDDNLEFVEPGSIFCGAKVWDDTWGRFRKPYDFAAPFDCGEFSIENNGAAGRVTEFHCPLGYLQSSPGTTCTLSTNECSPSTLAEVSWVATSNPQYFNHDGCLWTRTSSSANGENFNVSYEGSGWHEMDEDSIGTACATDCPAVPDGAAPASAPPAAAEGEDWPFDEDTGPTPVDEAVCTAGRVLYTNWPYDEGAGNTVEDMCMNTGCRAETGDAICMESHGSCGGWVTLTGEMCDGTEDTLQGTDEASGPASGSADLGGVEQRLEQIYSRLGTNQVADALGNAAVIAAIGSAADQISEAAGAGAGECADESCSAALPTIGEAVDLETGLDAALARIEAAPIVAAFTDLGSTITAPTECPSFTSDPIAQLNDQTLTITAQCDLWEDVAPVLSAVMLIIYTMSGAFIIFRA